MNINYAIKRIEKTTNLKVIGIRRVKLIMNNLKIEAEKEAQIILNYFKTRVITNLLKSKAKKLIKKFPNYLAVYNLLGLCLQSQKKISEAMKYYKIAIQNES